MTITDKNFNYSLHSLINFLCILIFILLGDLLLITMSKSYILTAQTLEQKSSVTDVLDIHIDNPTFRRFNLMIVERNLSNESSNLKEFDRYKIKSSLSKLISIIYNCLDLSGFFKETKLSFYSPPLFPWPAGVDINIDIDKNKNNKLKSSSEQIKNTQKTQSVSKDIKQTIIDWLKLKPNTDKTKKIDLIILAEAFIKKKAINYRLYVLDWPVHKIRFISEYSNNMSERDIAYDFSDKILTSFTNKSGIFKSRIVFIGKKDKNSSKQVYSIRIDGTDLKAHTNINTIHLSPSWHHDGKQIIYTSYQNGNPDLYIHNINTKISKKISGYKGIDSGGTNDPLSHQVVFSGSKKGDTDIYVTSSLGSKARRALITGSGLDVDPVIAPNGKYLAFVSGRFGNPHIFLANLVRNSKGSLYVSSDRRLTWAGWYNGNPDFSPDSKKIAFAGYDKEINRFDIFMMDYDGKNLERLTLEHADNESPSWSPNGQLIVFDSNRIAKMNKKSTKHLYIMRRDGSYQKKLETNLYSAQTPDWGAQIND